MKKCPFDLKRALAGERLVTRDGTIATDFHLRPDYGGDFKYSAEIAGILRTFTENGRWLDDSEEHMFDLFMTESDKASYEEANSILFKEYKKILEKNIKLFQDLQDAHDEINNLKERLFQLETDKTNPWIEWSGGECPISRDENCEVRFRDGEEYVSPGCHHMRWSHNGWAGDIVAYRIIDPL